MLERIPNLKFFSNAYWNQMGSEVYGDIGAAFRQFLVDAASQPDGGKGTRRQLYGELMLILNNNAYDHWVQANRTNADAIKAVDGRFIMPDQVQLLMDILDEKIAPDT